MCRWPLHARPTLSEVTPALLCHESPLSQLTMLIQAKSVHAYVASQIFCSECINILGSSISEVTMVHTTEFLFTEYE